MTTIAQCLSAEAQVSLTASQTLSVHAYDKSTVSPLTAPSLPLFKKQTIFPHIPHFAWPLQNYGRYCSCEAHDLESMLLQARQRATVADCECGLKVDRLSALTLSDLNKIHRSCLKLIFIKPHSNIYETFFPITFPKPFGISYFSRIFSLGEIQQQKMQTCALNALNL